MWNILLTHHNYFIIIFIKHTPIIWKQTISEKADERKNKSRKLQKKTNFLFFGICIHLSRMWDCFSIFLLILIKILLVEIYGRAVVVGCTSLFYTYFYDLPTFLFSHLIIMTSSHSSTFSLWQFNDNFKIVTRKTLFSWKKNFRLLRCQK